MTSVLIEELQAWLRTVSLLVIQNLFEVASSIDTSQTEGSLSDILRLEDKRNN